MIPGEEGRGSGGPSYEQLARRLRALILEGVFAPGTRLSEDEVVALFGVGRSTVREAFRILSGQGLVTVARGSRGGAYVSRPDVGIIGEQLELTLSLLAGSRALGVDQLVEAREVLEVPAARLAALRRRPEHLAALRGCLFSEDLKEPLEVVWDCNFRFHLTLMDAAGNPLLKAMTWPVFAVLRARYLRERVPDGFWRQVLADHRRLLAAVEAGDGEGAAGAMAEHIAHLGPVYRMIAREVPSDGKG
jgi:DNA-binding FadR family transcriptional regulator